MGSEIGLSTAKTLNGAYRSRTGDLLLAKHGFHEIDHVRRWKNRGTDTLRTGRLYDTHVIRVIEIKQVADVADRRVMSSSHVGRQAVQLTTKVRSRIPERKPAPTRGRGGLVFWLLWRGIALSPELR